MKARACFLAACLALASGVSGESRFMVEDVLAVSGSGNSVVATGQSRSTLTYLDPNDEDRKFWVRGKLLAPGFPLFNTDNCSQNVVPDGELSLFCDTDLDLNCNETVNATTSSNFHGDPFKYDSNQGRIDCQGPDPNGTAPGTGAGPDNTGSGNVGIDPCGVLGTLCGSPLVVDIDRDGQIPTSSIQDGLVAFDLDGDGIPSGITWTAPGAQAQPFLWLDLNGNGRPDSGRELFGDATRHPTEGTVANHGFHALGWYDHGALGGDQDGLITAEDLVWSRLGLWTDSNHNATAEPWELDKLSASGISALGLDYWFDKDVDSAGNGHLFKSLFVASGGVAEVHDLFFQIQR